MFYLYDHRAADVVISSTATARQGQPSALSEKEHQDPTRYANPRHWFPEKRLLDITENGWRRRWMLAWRDLTSATNARTLVPCVLPWVAFGRNNVVPLFPGSDGRQCACLLAAMSSCIVDYVARQKLGGLHAAIAFVDQLPVPPPEVFEENCAWSVSPSLRDWISARVLELTFTAWDLAAFAQDCGYEGPPFCWDEERRFLLQCELDAAYFHLYLGSSDDWGSDNPRLVETFPTPRDAVDYIMETFPIVRRRDVQAHGEYRTKRVILKIYDAMATAIRTGQSYQTRLDPPPADPRVAHSPKESKVSEAIVNGGEQ